MSLRRNPRLARKGNRRNAFTLLEVMLVLVIISAIAALAVVNLGGYQDRANQRVAENYMNILKGGLRMYKMEVGSFPTQLDALYEQPSDLADPSRWVQAITEPVKADPWGNAYEYTAKGAEGFELKSSGPDGQSGTDDDITVAG